MRSELLKKISDAKLHLIYYPFERKIKTIFHDFDHLTYIGNSPSILFQKNEKMNVLTLELNNGELTNEWKEFDANFFWTKIYAETVQNKRNFLISTPTQPRVSHLKFYQSNINEQSKIECMSIFLNNETGFSFHSQNGQMKTSFFRKNSIHDALIKNLKLNPII